MSLWDWVVSSYAASFCLGMAWFYLSATRALLRIPVFESLHPPPPSAWPKLSIVVTARDEAHTIGEAVRTLLNEDYPHLQIILINDRSTDDTGKVIDDLANESDIVTPVHIKRLPPGWLGKVHALHEGYRHADGDFVLFSDADIHFGEGTLRKAISWLESEGAGHLTLLPRIHAPSFGLEIAIRNAGLLFVVGAKAAHLDQEKSNAFLGIGAFNLVRKTAFDQSPGFEWLKMEVVDDMGLGLMLRESGARTLFALTRERLWLTWYPSLCALFHGLEKNGFAVAGYRLERLLTIVCLFFASAFALPAALLYPGVPFLWAFGLLTLITIATTALVARHRLGWRLFPFFFAPAALLVAPCILARAGFLCLRRGGIIWRGTAYALKDLRAGQRIKL